MPDEPPSAALDRELTTNIVAAYVRRNQIGSDQANLFPSQGSNTPRRALAMQRDSHSRDLLTPIPQ